MNTPYPKPRMPYNNNTKLSSNSLFAKKEKKKKCICRSPLSPVSLCLNWKTPF